MTHSNVEIARRLRRYSEARSERLTEGCDCFNIRLGLDKALGDSFSKDGSWRRIVEDLDDRFISFCIPQMHGTSVPLHFSIHRAELFLEIAKREPKLRAIFLVLAAENQESV